jgi:O-antigen/teichoic acid export membrane protein
MFFLLLTGMIISFVVAVTLLLNGEMVFGIIATAIGILLLLFVLFYYGKRKYRKKKKYDWTPDCLDFDCGPDCDGGPDCDCGPDCN